MLGGQGTAVQRFSKKDVTVGTGARKHTIIRAGEMYVSVSREWNTWAPAFAGDDCMFSFNFQRDMDEQAEALGWTKPQKVFHLFADAPATRTRGAMALPESAWHGKGAAGKGVYYGRYQLDEEGPEQTVRFTQLPECTQTQTLALALPHLNPNPNPDPYPNPDPNPDPNPPDPNPNPGPNPDPNPNDPNPNPNPDSSPGQVHTAA